ncbi:hypothetical protein DFP85_110107 [Halomonas ventosae]|uniref:Outer membrane protein n=1 Tax=Halomonas ventosae TaxID=229007 RepID=A0A4R6ZKV7_9GAMM|nr:hypothetical protein [Halomonas ventosae]TDR53041.1 hypothetical protein DFP85_110107 [Halomonas ventosae]
MRTIIPTVIVAGVATIGSVWFSTAHAQWSGEITPYLWAAGIDGDATVQGNDVEIDVGFDDLLDNTDLAGSVLGVLRRDRLVFWGQVDYFSLSTGAVDTPSGASAELETDSVIWTLAAGYQFDGWMPGQHVDVMLGARQLSLDNELSISGVGTFTRDKDYTDAVVVVRPSLPINERWLFNPTLSFGTGDSDSTWELWPQFQYKITDTWAARIGYRRLHYDIEGDAGNEFDAAFHGLVVGFGGLF